MLDIIQVWTLSVNNNVPNLERFIKDMQNKLPLLDFEGKRLALDMLGITVYLDGENVEIAGVICPEDSTSGQTPGLRRTSLLVHRLSCF